MSCCSPRGYDEFFTERIAERDARRYRERGLDPAGQRVVDYLRARGVDGATVLEVGGGVGALQLELLAAGAERAVNVELADSYEPHATALARDRGLEHRIERRVSDFVTAEDVEAADVVILHKVVCCYPDHRTLVGAAAERARGVLVLTLPRDTWLNRAGFRALNVVQRIRRQAFRVFVHDPDAVLRVAIERGLRRTRDARGFVWQFAALERS